MTFEYEGRSWWSYPERIDSPPQTPLYSVLRWILNQLNMGCAEFIGEGDTPACTHSRAGTGGGLPFIGKGGLRRSPEAFSGRELAGIFAKARERGVEPEYEELVEKAVRLANENAKMNTEFHYAFELVDILERISDKTFVFNAPPIVGGAEPQTLDLLQEATRCYLFGLHRACVAVCRTALEDSLKQRVPPTRLLEEGMQGGKAGELEKLINAAVRARVLPRELSRTAHDIRLRANDVLHKADRDVPDPWQLLLDTRTIVDAVHTRPQKR